MLRHGNRHTAYTTCSRLNQHGLARTQLPKLKQRLPRREADEGNTGSLHERRVSRLVSNRGGVDRRELRIGAMLNRPGEGQSHDLVTHLPISHFSADLGNATRDIKPRHNREGALNVLRELPGPQASINRVHPRRGHFDKDLLRPTGGLVQLPDLQYLSISMGFVKNCAHCLTPAMSERSTIAAERGRLNRLSTRRAWFGTRRPPTSPDPDWGWLHAPTEAY